MRHCEARFAGILIALLPLLAGGIAAGQTAAPSDAPLGSLQFEPTPARPVGWRGDWTGRYPGATPPLEWSRRVVGLTSDLRCQSAKPTGEPGADAHPLEYFTLKDFLILGPFDAADPIKDIDKEFFPNEATIEPAEGDKVGDVAWKPIHVSIETQSSHFHNGGICRNLNLDFIYTYGKFSEVVDPKKDWEGATTKIDGDFTNKLAYGNTYIYSPTGGPARLQIPFVGATAKCWINGKAIYLDKNAHDNSIDLVKGWNRLLVKVSCAVGLHTTGDAANQSQWRFAAYITPKPPVSYETHNIAWMTRVTGRSMSQPIVVGDKLFVGSNISDLMCFSRTDGKVLWIRSNTPWDALSPEDQAQYKDPIEPMVTQLNQLNDGMVTAINEMVSSNGMDSDQQAALGKKLLAKRTLELKIHEAFRAIDKKRFPPMNGNEVSSSNGTPCSDGTRVYWACGGGMKGTGASVVCAFDLDGKRIWSYHEAFGAAEHGLHTSAVVIDGKVIYPAFKTLIAFDSATGKVDWRTKTDEFCGNNIQPARIGNETYIVSHQVAIFQVSDGAMLTSTRVAPFGDTTPVVEDGVMYHSSKFRNWGNYNVAFAVVPLPNPVTEKASFPKGWEMSSHDCYMPLRGIDYIVASPLYLDGIVYNMDMTGGLAAIDVKAQKPLYRLWLDWYARYDRYCYGSVASPTLGGKNIYCFDDAGTGIVFAPGDQYKQVARNIVENIDWSGEGGNPCKQESFYTAPVFDGSDMYLKGEEYMYCIRAK